MNTFDSEHDPRSKAIHELITPLNHIAGCSQLLLLDETLESQRRELTAIILKASLELNCKIQEHLTL